MNPNQYLASFGTSVYTVTLLDDNRARIDDEIYLFDLAETGQGQVSLKLNDAVFEISAIQHEDDSEDHLLHVRVNGNLYDGRVEDHQALLKRNALQRGQRSTSDQTVRAPMPGKVLRIEVSAGDPVAAGSGLIVLEAMKMENEIKSMIAGSVKTILVDAGRAVEKGEPLIVIEPG
ncbi:MAG TPA: biotin/lipoyl-containing protein [Bacteroidota bacterium]